MTRARQVAILIALALVGCASRQRGELAGAQRAMARELLARGEYASAFSTIDAVCRANPRDADALALRGVVYREQGLSKEAKADLEEAVRLSPGSAAAHSALAIVYDGAGERERALEHHEKASRLQPGDPSYLNNLGFALFARGRAREAIPVLRDALRAAPADPRIRNNLGFCYAATGDLAAAAEQFERGGTQAQARNNLAYAYERRGNTGQAFELYLEAVRLDPGSQIARDNLTRLARQLHREVPADVGLSPRG